MVALYNRGENILSPETIPEFIEVSLAAKPACYPSVDHECFHDAQIFKYKSGPQHGPLK